MSSLRENAFYTKDEHKYYVLHLNSNTFKSAECSEMEKTKIDQLEKKTGPFKEGRQDLEERLPLSRNVIHRNKEKENMSSLKKNERSTEVEHQHYEQLISETFESAECSEKEQTKIDCMENKIGQLEERHDLQEQLYPSVTENKSSLKETASSTEDKHQHYEQLNSHTFELAERKEMEKATIDQLEKKIGQLEEERRLLEERLYPSAFSTYNKNPKLASVIQIKTLKEDSKSETRPIFGMTILCNKLYVVTQQSSEIEVYDSVTCNSETTWQIDEMANPLDIAACTTNNCLYIYDGKDESEILRVDSGKTYLKKWFIKKDGGHLSVTRDGNVVVSLFHGNKITEYSPDGKLVREIRLSPIDNISQPWHSIKTTSMHFIFSHGMSNGLLHRVCVVNADGKIIKSFGERKGSSFKEKRMNRPVHLLEDSLHNVLVADMKNKRVIILSPTLEYSKILISAKDKSKLRFPMRLCLNEDRGILFVADNNYKMKKGVHTYDGGRILIFNCNT